MFPPTSGPPWMGADNCLFPRPPVSWIEEVWDSPLRGPSLQDVDLPVSQRGWPYVLPAPESSLPPSPGYSTILEPQRTHKELPQSVPDSLPRTSWALSEEEIIAEPPSRQSEPTSPAPPPPSEASPTSSRLFTRNLLRRASSNILLKNTIDESVPVEDEGHFSLSRKTSRAPSIASVEEARPTTPVSEGNEKL
jgi:hypothetical protein